MSDYEIVRGKLKKLTNSKHESEIYAQSEMFLREHKPDLGFCLSWVERLLQDYDEGFVFIKECLYSIEKLNRQKDDDFCEVNVDSEGNIEFFTRYYNGATNWQEMVKDELSKGK